MSGYYARVSNISGAKSSVATSAYMSREKLKDDTMNRTFNYSGHEHDNTFSNITLCENAPAEWQDKSKLWNAVEEAEKGKNTRKARQWILAIPQELTREQQEEAVKMFQEFLAEKGMCSQADIHEAESKRSAATIEKNKHVHVLATQRLINAQGEWEQIKEKKVYANCTDSEGKPSYNPDIPSDKEHRIPVIDKETGEQKFRERKGKGREMLWERVTIQDNPLNKKELIEESRAKWAEICNQYLSVEQRIDNRSYERQGIDKISELHEGVGTYQDHDDRVEYNRTVKLANESMEIIKSVHPHEATEIKENLHGIRQGIEHDRDSGGPERDYPGTAGSGAAPSGGENEIERRTPESTVAASIGTEEKREEFWEILRDIEIAERKREAERIVGELAETVSRVRAVQSDNIREQSVVGEETQSVRDNMRAAESGQRENLKEQRSINEKLHSIRDRIKQVFENIRAKIKDNHTDKEKEVGAAAAPVPERVSVREKLHHYEQVVKEERAEKQQSEQTKEKDIQQPTKKKGIHR